MMPENTITILVIRHGESEADILNVHEGRADFELTGRGQRQAAAMAQYVARNYKLSRIYASTLKRARQTADCLSHATGIEVNGEPDLMEFNNGLLAGLPFDEADRLYPEVKDLPIDKAVYGQESKVEFRARAERVLKRILSECTDNNAPSTEAAGSSAGTAAGTDFGIAAEAVDGIAADECSSKQEDITIAIVTHGGMINQLYGALLHMPVGESNFFATGDTGIHVWRLTSHGNYIMKANYTEHAKGI